MKSPARTCAAIAAGALCFVTPLVAAASADQDRPKVKVVRPAPDAPPAVVVEPPDPNLPSAVVVPPPGAKVEIAIAAVGPAPRNYPPCSATSTDRCIQTYERRRRR